MAFFHRNVNVKAEFVAILEAVRDGLFGTEDADGHIVDRMLFDARFYCLGGEPVHADRWKLESWYLRVTRKRYGYLVWDLGRQLVMGQRRNQADDAGARLERHRNEIGITDSWKLGQPIQPALQTFKEPRISQRVESSGVNTGANRLSRSDYAAAPLA